jgi:hypothetical protein
MKKRTYPKDVEFSVEADQDDMNVRGNAIFSGDAEEDKKVEDEIIHRLKHGDVWAWCWVHVIAKYGGFQGDAYLGGCSYKDEKEFKRPGGYYEQMKEEAYDNLLARMRRAGETLGKFKKEGGSLAKDVAEVNKLLK